MSSRCSINWEWHHDWHIWWDVNTPEVVIQSPKNSKLILTLEQAEELRDGLNDALEYWNESEK